MRASYQPPDLRQHLRALRIQRGDLVDNLLRAAMGDFFAAARVLHRQVEGFLVDGLGVDGPALGRVGLGLLQLHELGQVVVVQGIGLAQVAAGVELVEPGLARGRAFVEEEHYRCGRRCPCS